MMNHQIKYIKSKGFSHIKIELEATFDQEPYESECGQCEGTGSEDCNHCSGEGCIDCSTCNGERTITQVSEKGEETIPCVECDGSGQQDCPICETSQNVTCSRCDGQGSYETSHEDVINDVERRMITHLQENRIKTDWIEAYNDGTVHIEVTLTVELQYIPQLPLIINLFKMSCEQAHSSINDNNAGLHITLLTSGNYPTRDRLPELEVKNFKQAMGRLMPILYLFAGYGNGYTRDYGYRRPGINGGEKHSAIFTNGDTSIEYRIFDPCFDQPERILHFVKIIARTLKFYSKKTYNLKMRKQIMFNQTYELTQAFPESNNRELKKAIHALVSKNKKVEKCWSKDKQLSLKALAMVAI